jgi:hypothetical protein
VSPGELILYLSPSSLLHPGRLKAIMPKELIPSKSVPSNSNRSGIEDLNGLPLSTSALLSLVLAIYAAQKCSFQEDGSTFPLPPGFEHLRSFLDSLPEDLSTIPLVWSRHAKSTGDTSQMFAELCGTLPTHSKQMLVKVEERYEKDLRQAGAAFAKHRERIAQTLQATSLEDWKDEHFIWGWLCVNS